MTAKLTWQGARVGTPAARSALVSYCEREWIPVTRAFGNAPRPELPKDAKKKVRALGLACAALAVRIHKLPQPAASIFAFALVDSKYPGDAGPRRRAFAGQLAVIGAATQARARQNWRFLRDEGLRRRVGVLAVQYRAIIGKAPSGAKGSAFQNLAGAALALALDGSGKSERNWERLIAAALQDA